MESSRTRRAQPAIAVPGFNSRQNAGKSERTSPSKFQTPQGTPQISIQKPCATHKKQIVTKSYSSIIAKPQENHTQSNQNTLFRRFFESNISNRSIQKLTQIFQHDSFPAFKIKSNWDQTPSREMIYSPNNPKTYFPKTENNIENLRAIAVLAVFFHHAAHVFGVKIPFFGEYGGQFSPQLFFLISGYLISASADKHDIKTYFKHRFLRIFPAYWFYFLTFGVVTKTITTEKLYDSPIDFLSNITLLQHLIPEALIKYDVLHVTWTLTVEILWYLIAPFFILKYKSITNRSLALSIIISTAFVLMASFNCFDFLIEKGVVPLNGGYLFINNNFLSQLCFFFMGGYIYFQEKKLKNLPPFGLILIFATIFLTKDFWFSINPIFVTGLGLMMLFTFSINTITFKNATGKLISDISFSFYLCHFPIILAVKSSGVEGGKGLILAFLISVILSKVTYHCIEQPCMRVARRKKHPTYEAKNFAGNGSS